MPYTPPATQSPASSTSASPTSSRSSSYTQYVPPSPVTGRPQLPRSSSASYMTKHRRSPSLPKSDAAPPTPTDATDGAIQTIDFARTGTVRQSPPPVNNLLMPTGAVISPPDSSENSDGDESDKRARELEQSWDRLQEAVQGIRLTREGSPAKDSLHLQTSSAPVSETTSPTALTPEARKISHSRSSTETAIIAPRTAQFSESPTQTTDDSDEDQDPLSKPSLVRKKSGELVKPALRPSSRRRYSSMPGTPTYSKSVHFNDTENQTRHFLQVDKPIAVSAGSSPVETYDSESEYPWDGCNVKPEREIKLANFPEDRLERRLKPVRVERIFLSTDKQTLIGICAVQNLDFHKLVVVRFTLDAWKTTSEVVAEYNNDLKSPNQDACDRFNFHIKLSDQANIDNKTLLLCVRYNVSGHDFWDNNEGMNYQIDFTKTVAKKAPKVVVGGLGARPLNAIPRSRHSPPTSSHGRGRQESMDDDFGSRFDLDPTYHFGSPDKLLGESAGSVKLKPRSKRGSVFPTGPAAPSNNLGGRYDFGASLSAALSSAQDKLGRQSGLMNGNAQRPGGSYFGPQERKGGPTTANEKPDVTGGRPAMGSDQYRDLVQKFCYFTSGSGKGVASPLEMNNKAASAAKPAAQTDGAVNDTDSASTHSSGSTTPAQLLDGSSDRKSPALSPFISRSGSPAPVTGQDFGRRAASPVSFGYPYHHRDGYLSDSHQPTPIRG